MVIGSIALGRQRWLSTNRISGQLSVRSASSVLLLTTMVVTMRLSTLSLPFTGDLPVFCTVSIKRCWPMSSVLSMNQTCYRLLSCHKNEHQSFSPDSCDADEHTQYGVVTCPVQAALLWVNHSCASYCCVHTAPCMSCNRCCALHGHNCNTTCQCFRKVTVRHIVPGSPPPTDVDYWWEQEHDRRFYTFVDNYPAGSARQSHHTAAQPRVCNPALCSSFASVHLCICWRSAR